jgi:anti-sigma B factor antagonist
MNLSINRKEKSKSFIVELKGEVDLFTAPAFKEAVYEILDAGNNRIIIDLSGLEFMDSTGLGVLLGALRRLRTTGGSLALVCDRENIVKIFQLTGLDQVFTIYEKIEDCIIE